MKIAILGAGRIGSTFGFLLARDGHEVTMIARGERLAQLEREGAIVTVTGERAAVKATSALPTTVPFELVIVTVMAHQVDAVLPQLTASAATSILFLFNSFDPTARLREAVGSGRAIFGFPNMAAFLTEGKLRYQVNGPGMNTTLESVTWASVFAKAGLPTAVETDMDSFLRSHVAFAVPLLAAGCLVYQRGAGLTWAETGRYAAAMVEALEVVRGLGHALLPSSVATLARLPRGLVRAMLWIFSRTAAVRDTGQFGPAESRQLIDAMTAAAPGKTQALLAIRP